MDFETITTALVGGYVGSMLFKWYQGGGVNFDIAGDVKAVANNPIWGGLPYVVAWLAVSKTPDMFLPMADIAGGYMLPALASFATCMGEKMYFTNMLAPN